MSIIKAAPSDLIEALFLFKAYVQEMNCQGWFHWEFHNSMLKNDIENNVMFLYKENEVCLGMISLNTEEKPEYKTIHWSETSSKPLIAQRLIVHPNWRNQGIAKKLLAFAEEHARENGFTSLRLDVFAENEEAVALYHHLNFSMLGEIKFHYQQVPFYCFEKIISKG